MFTVYFFKGTLSRSVVCYSYETACAVAYNEVEYIGCDLAYVKDESTGEILREYIKG